MNALLPILGLLMNPSSIAATPAEALVAGHQERPVVVAHRGASSIAPENTLAAIKAAAKLGARAVEFDVHRSQDGSIVLIHDHTLARTTNGRGLVRKRTLDALQSLDAGSWFSPEFKAETIPTLEEALAVTPDTMVACIEIKTREPVVGTIRKILERTNKKESAVIFSFVPSQIRATVDQMPTVPALLLVDISLGSRYTAGSLAKSAQSAGTRILGLAHHGVTRELVERLHAAGLTVFVYTVDSAQDVKRMVLAGVDGIISNKPRATLSRLHQYKPQSN